MSEGKPKSRLSSEELKKAIALESEQFQKCYLWLEAHMPPSFFEEVSQQEIMLVAHQLIAFELNEHFARIHLKDAAIVLCLDSPDADLKILKEIKYFGIKNYQTYISDAAPPLSERIKENLRIAVINFTVLDEPQENIDKEISSARKSKLLEKLKTTHPEIDDKELTFILRKMSSRFIRSLSDERLF